MTTGVIAVVGYGATRPIASGDLAQRTMVVEEGPAGQLGPIEVGLPPENLDDDGVSNWGPFRLVRHEDQRPPLAYSNSVEELRNAEDIRKHALYVEPGFVPDGYTQAHVDGLLADGALSFLSLTYRGPYGYELIITRRKFVPPFDVGRPIVSPDATKVMELGFVGDREAVFIKPKPGLAGGTAQILVAHGDVLTTLTGDITSPDVPAIHFEDLLKVAESIPQD